MKRAIQKHLLLVAVLVTMVNYAGNISLSSDNDDIKKTVLTLNNVKEGQQLLIKDVNGIILYKEQIKKAGTYAKGFDLTELPDGNYFFELNKDVKIQVIPFNVNLNVVSFKKEGKTTIYKPFVKAKNNIALVSTLSLKAKPVTVSIYYDNNGAYELIHNETIENTTDIQKAYSLDANKKGAYKFVFTTEGRTFVNNITL